MALTIALEHPYLQAVALGNVKARLVKVTFDNSYATGGKAFAPADVGLSEFFFLQAVPRYTSGATGGSGRTVEYDFTNKKLLVFQQKDPAAAGGADIQLPEVGNTTDLSTMSVDVLCLGV